MVYHILNGDSLAQTFPTDEIKGQHIIIREAFIEGPLSKNFSEEFWQRRMEFIAGAYGADEKNYNEQFRSQLRLMDSIQAGDEVNLWFEDDLFCLTNMLFVFYYVTQKTSPVFYRVFSKEDNKTWSGFGKANAKELIDNYNTRQ